MSTSLERHAAGTTPPAERPDPSYWTIYDHYMVEREARALRRAYAWSLVVRAWRAVRVRSAGARARERRPVRELSPRT